MPQPASRIISWQQLVQEADPDWLKDKLRPVRYEFTNGKIFVARPDEYTTAGP